MMYDVRGNISGQKVGDVCCSPTYKPIEKELHHHENPKNSQANILHKGGCQTFECASRNPLAKTCAFQCVELNAQL